MRRPALTNLPRLDKVCVPWRDYSFSMPYFYREGAGGPTILFVHGLGGAKENSYAAFQSEALATCTLVAFDLPGTGLAQYVPESGLDVSGLAELTRGVADQLIKTRYWLAGASMGGLISLLQIRKYGLERIQGVVNLEGNLCPRRLHVLAPRRFAHPRFVRPAVRANDCGAQ
jgi:pimeloyl-ACP methyl ester carboxylesterase